MVLYTPWSVVRGHMYYRSRSVRRAAQIMARGLEFEEKKLYKKNKRTTKEGREKELKTNGHAGRRGDKRENVNR